MFSRPKGAVNYNNYPTDASHGPGFTASVLLCACQIILEQANFDSGSTPFLSGASVSGGRWRIAHPQNVDAMDWDLMIDDQVMGNRVCHLPRVGNRGLALACRKASDFDDVVTSVL